MVSLPDHFESYLGPIEEGWAHDTDGIQMPFQIARYKTGGADGTLGFSTLGVSKYGLESPTSGREIRQEFFVSLLNTDVASAVPDLLFQVAMGVLTSGRPLLRGDVVGPRGPLLPGSPMEGFYVTAPVYLPDEFAVAHESSDIVVAWMVPVSVEEANFVRSHGWSRFEDVLVERDPDLNDIFRQPLNVH